MTRVVRRHPEGIALAFVLAAWCWMVAEAAAAGRFACCAPRPSLGEDFTAWMGMIVAMMVPTTFAGLRYVAERSYAERRVRAVGTYLLGYLACWALLGAVVATLRWAFDGQDPNAAPMLCLFGAGWALLPARERWFELCHRRIRLHPVGFRADRDVFRQGALNGAPCVLMCWPLMLACTLTGHNLLMMFGGTVLALLEKQMRELERGPIVMGSLVLGGLSLAV